MRGLSVRQRQIATYGGRDKRWTCVSGPVGSGKTHAAIIGFFLWQRNLGDCDLGILTKGHAQLNAVLKGGFAALMGEEVAISDGHFKLPGSHGRANRVWCFVGHDKSAEPRLRSFNLAGMLLDEATTLPDGLLAAANARCRVGDSKLVALTNPDGPRHPFKVSYLDNLDGIHGEAIYTELADNPSLSKAYIDSLKAHYSGHMLDRMVYGKWSAASGLVFPHLATAATERIDLADIMAFDVSIDVGDASVTHALLGGRTLEGTTWILDEMRHDHTILGVLPERELVAKVRRAFAAYDVGAWIVDPAAKTFRQELIAQLPRGARVGKAENDWLDGVEEVNHWVARGALKVQAGAVDHLMTEVAALVWDERAAEIGEDKPIKTSDHGTDALRYLVLTRAVHESGGRKAWDRRQAKRKERT